MTNPFYPNLFSPVELGGYTLRNRIIHASIVTQYVVNHAPSEKLLNYYRSRAAGGAAAIITEPIAMTAHNRPVLPGSRSQPGMDISSTSFYPRGRIDGKTTMAGI